MESTLQSVMQKYQIRYYAIHLIPFHNIPNRAKSCQITLVLHCYLTHTLLKFDFLLLLFIEMSTNEDIQSLLRRVEKRLGRPLKSPTDFDLLSLRISETLSEHLSATTLKRMWGYINTNHTPRYSTLSILARYLEYADYDDFVAKSTLPLDESGFISCNYISAEHIAVGDRIEICWQPDRRCVVIYNGANCFTVQESFGAKIVAGDTFTALNFMVGHPLYITNLRHGGDAPRSYVAGSTHGLTRIMLLK